MQTCLPSASLLTLKNQNHIIIGDLNLPQIKWNSHCCPVEHVYKKIFDFVLTHGYRQVVDFPTRGNNILDVILTDDDCIVTTVKSCPPIGYSDHVAIEFTMTLTSVDRNVLDGSHDKCHYLWYSGDFDNMISYLLNVDWNAVLCYNPSAEQMWKVFNQVLWSAVDQYVPSRFTSGDRKVGEVQSKPKKPHKLRKCAVRKRKLWNKLQVSPHDSDLRRKYRESVHLWRELLHANEIVHEQRIVEANNLGAFYRFVNTRISNRSTVGAIVDEGLILTDNQDKANAFNKYFSSVGVADNGSLPHCRDMQLTDVLECVAFNEADIANSIDRLKCNLSAGPDGLPPMLFKKLKYCISRPLAMLFDQLVSVGYVPQDWLNATIVPVFKKGAAGKLCNYRPISLTCVLSKIMERVLSNKIYAYLLHNNILHCSQHGFCKNRSTTTNLLECFNDWTLTVLSKEQHVIVYIDFSKAFDVVSHPKLFARLYSYGIRGTVLTWLKNFFSSRMHQTKVGTALSDTAMLCSGVVQGSGIGPLMFLVYINELLYLLERHSIKVKMFADDVKMYLKIINDVDIVYLQAALTSLVEWANEWQLAISIEKCCVLNIGKQVPAPLIHLDNCPLPVVPLARDLGVLVSNSLCPSAHINDIVAKAHKRTYMIQRAFVSRDIDLLVRAYLVYVRPLVEYNSVVWSPYTIQDIKTIERVQRRFTKDLPGLRKLTYKERLHHLHLPSLELRHLHADLVWCYKILFSIVETPTEEFFVPSMCASTRGHQYKLFKKPHVSRIRANFFSERVVNSWNSLPDSVDFSSLPRFKRSINKVDFSQFLKCF